MYLLKHFSTDTGVRVLVIFILFLQTAFCSFFKRTVYEFRWKSEYKGFLIDSTLYFMFTTILLYNFLSRFFPIHKVLLQAIVIQ